MCKRSNYTQNAPQYEGDCEYRISSNHILHCALHRNTQKLVCANLENCILAKTHFVHNVVFTTWKLSKYC